MNKREEFFRLIDKNDADIILVTETKLDGNILDVEISVDGYSIYRCDRQNQRAPGGGVLIMVKESLNSGADSVQVLNTHSYDESIWCEINLNNVKLLVGCIYRPPSSRRDKNLVLNDLVNIAGNISNDSQILICGDFNYSSIDWVNNDINVNAPDHDARLFLDCINDCFLHQHVNVPTHNIDGPNPTQLDLIFTENPYSIEDLELLAPLGKSHHATLKFNLQIDGADDENDHAVYKYCYYSANYDVIRNKLNEIDWDEIFSNKDANEMFNIFVDTSTDIIDRNVRKVKCGMSKPKPKWLTNEVKIQIDIKDKAWKRLKARRTPLRAEKYRQERNKTKIMVQLAKKVFDKKLCEDIKINPKHFWSYIRSKTRLKEKVCNLKKSDGTLTKTDEETANEFNKAFQKVFVTENSDDIPQLDCEYNGPNLEMISVTEEDVCKTLKKLNCHKAAGPDGIPTIFLKECSSVLTKPITMIIVKSIEIGIVPVLWRLGKISTIFKKGSKTDPLNYRPISLTSTVGKVCETLIRNKIVEHLELNNILDKNQHGFRQKKSTVTNLLEYMEILTSAFDMQIPVDVNYLDCKKAFDTVPHKRLLVKMHGYGIRGQILAWIENFLKDKENL